MDPDTNGGTDRATWLRTNQGVGVCIAAVITALIVYLLTQDWVYTELRDGFHLGTFTVASAVVMLACAVGMTIDGHRADSEDDMRKMQWRDWLVVAVGLIGCFAYFQLAWNIDFLLITPFFLCAAMYVLGVRPLRTAIIAAVVTTVTIFFLFHLLGIDLPSFLTPG
ncbi:MAG: tripartite tricarboxylate transporter TctB family protein [Rhodospirillaceae bacterium]